MRPHGGGENHAILETLDLNATEPHRLRRASRESGRIAKDAAYTLSGGERRRAEITRAW